MGDIHIRFRHSLGDIGPFPFPGTYSVQAVKDKVIAEWPTSGALALELPAAGSDIKLILGGKFLDNPEVLDDLRPVMGDPKADIVTMHIVVRKHVSKKDPGGKVSDKVQPKGCLCC